MSQTEPPLLTTISNFGHVTRDDDTNKLNALPGQVAPDLPSWTPLRTLEDEEGSPASETGVDELTTRKTTESAMKRLERPSTNAQALIDNVITAGRTLPNAKPSGKKARFAGVLIATKPPLYRRDGSQTQSGPVPASSVRAFSLVDALARTFNANRHTEDPFPHQSHTTSRQHDDASTEPQTDVETTEAEDEQLQLNTRLARVPLKRRRVPGSASASANASETNSEDIAALPQDIPKSERSVKRLKPLQYESNPALIDAALGTVRAPISWEAEMDFITRDEDLVTLAQTVHVASTGARMAVDDGDLSASCLVKASVPSFAQTPVGKEWRMATSGDPQWPVLSPYLSRGAKFRQRLDAIFGGNVTVRTDKVARPRRVDRDLFTTLDEPEEPGPSASESTESVSSASTAEEVASAIPSTHITSQSPDGLPTDTNMDQLPSKQVNEADSSTKPTFDAGEEQMNSWITALQRLVKGKVRVKEEDLEMLSIILAEVESMKDSLNENVLMHSELRESIKQLSELHGIPFGDRNKLRQRAENIFHTWPSMGDP